VLATRLLALASIILAFAQPYSSSKKSIKQETETVLYIDNSFSMQAKGQQGTLLERSLQDIYEASNRSGKFFLFNNNETYSNKSLEANKNKLLAMPYTANQLSLPEILLRADQIFSKKSNTKKRLVIISDFQERDDFPKIESDLVIDAVQLQPKNKNNVSIDSAFVEKSGDKLVLNVKLSAIGKETNTIAVSLYNKGILKAKTATDFSSEKQNLLKFDLDNTDDFKGKIEISDGNLLYDNTLYFNFGKKKAIKVLSINEENSNFLSQLFKTSEFEYREQMLKNLSYSIIPEQNFIVLNGLKNIPNSLQIALIDFKTNGGSVCVIPAKDSDISNYNKFLTNFGLGTFSSFQNSIKQITNINFDHPLYQEVFEKKISNFQYPKINSYYNSTANAGVALKLEDGSPFIIQKNKNYLFTASLSKENGNFINSPLVVPTFYNMAQSSLKLPRLYFMIGKTNNFSIAEKLSQDEIVTIKDSISSFIPLQQTKANQVDITTKEEPQNAGTLDLVQEDTYLESISYNYDRTESTLRYADIKNWNGINIYDSITTLFDAISQENAIDSFWKWFAIFALFFLLLEMLILKFYK